MITFEKWKEELTRGLFHRSDETPRILSWIYDIVDEDLDEEESSEHRLAPVEEHPFATIQKPDQGL